MTFDSKHDPILDVMQAHNIPLTRENYIALNYLGNPPEELSAEEEAELPEAFQEKYPTVEDALVAVEIAELNRLMSLADKRNFKREGE